MSSRERLLGADGFLLAIRLHRPVIDSRRQRAHGLAMLAEGAPQDRLRRPAQVAEGVDAGCLDTGQRLLPDAVEPADGQGIENGVHIVRPEPAQSVGLAKVRRDLGEQLVGSDAHRCGEPERLANALPNGLGNGLAVAQQPHAAGDIQEGFVEVPVQQSFSELQPGCLALHSSI